MLTSKEKTPVFLTTDEALLFLEFQKHYELIGHIVGCLSALNIHDITNGSIILDFDKDGIISHTAITKHSRLLR